MKTYTSTSKDKIEKPAIIAGVASIPERASTLEVTINSIYWQVDEIHVYLNNFEKIPRFLNRPRIKVERSQDHGDLKDVGKFFALKSVSEGTLFTLDDDIRYPPDYVAKMTEALEALDRNAVVGVHGIILPKHPKSFFDRRAFTFYSRLNSALPVSFLGTGTCAFDIKNIGISLSDFPSFGMADLHLGSFIKKKNIPAVIVSRGDNWLEDLGESDSVAETLYDQTRRNSASHNRIIRDSGPWGQSDIMSRVDPHISSKIFSEEVRFSLGLIKNSSNKKSDLFRVPDGSSMNKPIVDSAPWLEAIADPGTLEEIYLNALTHRKTRLVRLTALSGLWKYNRALCVEKSREIVESQPNEATYLIEHAKYCAGLYLIDEAKLYFERAARQVGRSEDQSGIKLENILLEYFNFLTKFNYAEEALALSSLLEPSFHKHPIFNRGMFIAKLAKKEYEDAIPYLNSFFQHIKRGQGRRVRELIQSLLEFKGADDHEINVKISDQSIEICRTNPDFLVELMKVSFVLGDRIGAEKCWSRLTLDHSDYLEFRPELRWYYYSNINANKELKTLTSGRGPNSKGWSVVDEYQPLKNIAALRHGEKDRIFDVRVSIIMTAHNAEETIDYAMRSVLNQTHESIELIVVDDFSSDQTTAIVEEISRNDSRVVLIRNNENLGPYKSRNIAIDRSTGDFIAIHDADDSALPDRIECQLAAFCDGVEAVLGRHIRIDRSGHLQLENDGSIIGHGPMTLMFRRTAFDKVGPFSDVRTRGDKEYESRVEYYFGAHAIIRLPDILVCCLHDLGTNSHTFSSGPERRRALALFKEDYLRRHSSGSF